MEEKSEIFDLSSFRKSRYAQPLDETITPTTNRTEYFPSELGYNGINPNREPEGGLSMNEREYVDARLNALETNMNQKIQAQGELFTEKLNHIETKIDSNQSIIMAKLDGISNNVLQQNEIIKRDIEIVTSQKIDELKAELGNKQKETKNSMWMIAGVVAGVATLMVTVIQMFLK